MLRHNTKFWLQCSGSRGMTWNFVLYDNLYKIESKIFLALAFKLNIKFATKYANKINFEGLTFLITFLLKLTDEEKRNYIIFV
jgi:hypothetical protein